MRSWPWFIKASNGGHFPGVGRVLARQGRDVLTILEPRCTHTADVDEVLTRLQSHHEVGSGNESGGDGMMSSVRVRTQVRMRMPMGMRIVRTCYIWRQRAEE
nr:hypothetical protein [Tanacetum cinerariifolium]